MPKQSKTGRKYGEAMWRVYLYLGDSRFTVENVRSVLHCTHRQAGAIVGYLLKCGLIKTVRKAKVGRIGPRALYEYK